MKFKIFPIFIVMLMLLSGCANISTTTLTKMTEATTTETPTGPGERGNTIGNLNNIGDAVLAEDGFVYSSMEDIDDPSKYALYKSNLDGTNEVKIYSGETGQLNMLHGWIYFINYDDNSKIYKMDINGDNIQKLSDDQELYNMSVIDDWIYYSSYSYAGIFKMKTDGSGKVELCHFTTADLIVDDDWLCFSDYNTYEFYKMRVDGSDLTQVDIGPTEESNHCVVYVIDQDWIFYATMNSTTNECAFFKIQKDGSQKTKLSDHDLRYINTDGEWLYYSDYSMGKNLFKMKLDGSEITKLVDREVKSISVLGDWLRYTADHFEGEHETDQVKKDGTDNRVIRLKNSEYIIAD